MLAGHSLGGMCTTLYAEKYPKKVKGLAPISTAISGQLTNTTAYTPEYLEKWQQEGSARGQSIVR